VLARYQQLRGTVIGVALAMPLAPPRAGSAPSGDWFSEAAAGVGIGFVHVNGMSGELHDPEIVGPGAALFDDNAGDLNPDLVQGHTLGPEKTPAEASLPPIPGSAEGDRSYRSDLGIRADGSGLLRSTDLTEVAGIRTGGYGTGVAAGDPDNDGWVDRYVARYG
jgi:enediyne biosynthesis protein E4